MKKAHFIGIGGIGMSALARILKQKGVTISGSDAKQTAMTDALSSEGISIFTGHAKNQLPQDATIIYSTAIKDNNPEWEQAKENGAEMLHRSELLARLLKDRQMLAVAGTHGKTTTSAMLTWVLQFAGLDPSFAIGGLLKGQNGAHGTGPLFVAESCESDGTLLNYHPYAAIITNTDPDHLDYWKTAGALEAAYQTFARRSDILVWCKDSATMDTGTSYGFSASSDFHIVNFRQVGYRLIIDLAYKEMLFKDIVIAAIGKHNALNAAAVFALCYLLGVSKDLIYEGLKSFPGVSRRQEIIGEKQGLLIIDDYAHHPIEVSSTLSALKSAYPERRLVALFQPHRFTRLEAFFQEFTTCFETADLTFITDVYGAGEPPGIQAEQLAKACGAHYVADPSAIVSSLRPFDLLVTLGAGDITHFGRKLIKNFDIRKLDVALVYGGKSAEHAIAIKSADCIAEAMDIAKYNVKRFYIGPDGKFDSGCLPELHACDIAFPVFHGPNGEDGLYAALLEALGIPFVGCDYRSSAVCMDKVWAKQIVSSDGISVAPFIHFYAFEWQQNAQSVLDRIQKLAFPLWIKGVHLGSSIGVFKVERPEELAATIEQARAHDHRFIVEEHIPSTDLEVAILGNEHLMVSYPGEILIGDDFYDFGKKYDPEIKVTPHANLPADIEAQARALAAKCYLALGCSGWTRIDFLYHKERGLYFSEANPIPGCTPTSLYPKMCADMGVTYKELIDRLIALGLAKSYAAT
ncbi:MAG: UDP-N-acetylmuramate--L-alanine ligase [Chlamydiales bacterium]|nr:UDP-N-acetylmuramate--L-alanine ligase [Chlamydiales bacterium]